MIRSLLIVFCSTVVMAWASAADWPEDYVVVEGSESPDGQYGILIPNNDHEAGDNFLANLKTHQVVGTIEGEDADYFQGQNHRGLDVTWAKDSKVAIVDYEGRFGFESIYVLELKAKGFMQTEIGKHIHSATDAVIKKQSRGHEEGGFIMPLFRIEPGPKIRVYATALTNPKQLEDTKSYFALFQGLYDLPAKKWIKSTARPLSTDEYDLLERSAEDSGFERFKVAPEAFQGLNPDAEEPQSFGDDMAFRSEESEFKYLDNKMNDVYKAARVILPSAEFEKLKVAQREWLKKRDAARSVAEKCKVTAERIQALQDAAW